MPCFLKVSSRPRFTDTNGEFLVEVEPKYLFVNNCKYLQDLSIFVNNANNFSNLLSREGISGFIISGENGPWDTSLLQWDKVGWYFRWGARFVLSMGGKICIFGCGQDSGTILIFSSQLIASPQWFLLTRLPTMLTSPEIQFGPFTWCLEATPQGVDEDRLVVGEESSLKMILISMLMTIIVLFKLSFLIYI